MEVQILIPDGPSGSRPAPTATTDEGLTYALLEPEQKFFIRVALKESLTQSPKFKQQWRDFKASHHRSSIVCYVDFDDIHAREHLHAPVFEVTLKGHKTYTADRRIQGLKPFAAQSTTAFAEGQGLRAVKADTGVISTKICFIEQTDAHVLTPPSGADALEEQVSEALDGGNTKFGKKPALSIKLGKPSEKSLVTHGWAHFHIRKELAQASIRIDSESAVAARHLQGVINLDAASQARLKKYLRGPPSVINLIKSERHAHKKFKCDLTGESTGSGTWIKLDDEGAVIV